MSRKPTSILVAVLLIMAAPALAWAQSKNAPPAAERLNASGPEQRMLEGEVGTFDVVATLFPPGGAPIVSADLVAERVMVGPFLQETMRPKPDAKTPPSRAWTT